MTKTKNWLIVGWLGCSIGLYAQGEIKGVIRDVKNKPVKNHSVTLGNVHPQVTKTNKFGLFAFSDALLHDTLYIPVKHTDDTLQIAVNGYEFLKITSFTGDCKVEYLHEPDPDTQKLIARQQKMGYSSTLDCSDIEKSGCQDVYCLLTRLNVHVSGDGTVKVRGALSMDRMEGGERENGLIIVNGLPSGDSSILRTLTIQDIDEITVLKDASEYGVRGADGAIVIKTRIK